MIRPRLRQRELPFVWSPPEFAKGFYNGIALGFVLGVSFATILGILK